MIIGRFWSDDPKHSLPPLPRIHPTMKLPRRALGDTGLSLTEIGYGCAGIGNAYRNVSTGEAATLLETAWAHGVRYFDTAPAYGLGLSERRLGDFLRQYSPDEYVVSTKVGKALLPAVAAELGGMPFQISLDYSYDGIMRSYELSQVRLGLSKVDVLFVDDLEPQSLGFSEYRRHLFAFMNSGIRALDELRSGGAISAWGLGVNDVGACIDILHRVPLDCLLLNGRFTLLDRTAGTRLIGLCERSKTPIIVGSLFNGGKLAGQDRNVDDPLVQQAVAIRQVASQQQVSLDAAALQFPLRSGIVTTALLGTTRRERLTTSIASRLHTIPDAAWGSFTSLAVN